MENDVKNSKFAEDAAHDGDLSAIDIEQLKAQAAKAEENWDKYVRLNADFDNYKKRAARERQDSISYANESLISKLLPVMDTFEMALTAASNDASAKSLQAGVMMISQQLRSILADSGLEEIDATGKAFDPNLHEAISQEESSDAPDGQVLKQVRKGYKFRNRLMRPAGVIVARKPAA